jgi:asparagine synthase (glutamine-hydrolysing)
MAASESVSSLVPVVRAAIERAAGAGPCSVLYSGGVDSSIIARGAAVAHPTLVAVGVRDSHDLTAARTGASQLGRPMAVRELTEDDIRSARDRWCAALEGADATARAVTLGIALAMEASPPGPVLCGQGADELFLGYAHFRGLSPPAAATRRAADLERLTRSDWPRAQGVARALQRPLRAPFLDPGVVRAVLASDVRDHLPSAGVAKPVLRSVALALGVPTALASRPKKALQFGTGIARVLRRVERGPVPPVGTTAR